MLKFIPVFFLVFLSFIDCAPPKLYSRDRQEKWIADSLARIQHHIDSVRVADSLHVADSLTVLRYEESDSLLLKERLQEAAELKVVSTPINDNVPLEVSKEVDNVSGRVIVVKPDNPFAKTIDTLQKRMDSLNNFIHDNDSRFKEMKKFPPSEKKRYITFLLQNKMKDTSAILTYCEKVLEVYKIKHRMLIAIKNSQDMNTKTFIQSHIDAHIKKISDLNNFILTLTPKVPFFPTREVHKITEQ
jgi:hypothetical protein